jgi:hypothetical protein
VCPVVLFQQNKAGGKVNKGEEQRAGELIISGSNASEIFEYQEKAFHQMTLFVKPPVAPPRNQGIAL